MPFANTRRKKSSRIISWLIKEGIGQAESLSEIQELEQRAADLREAASNGDAEVVNALVNFHDEDQRSDSAGHGVWNVRSTRPQKRQMAGATKVMSVDKTSQKFIYIVVDSGETALTYFLKKNIQMH